MRNFIAICALSFALTACLGGGGGGGGGGTDSPPDPSPTDPPATPSATQGIDSPGSVAVVPAQDE